MSYEAWGDGDDPNYDHLIDAGWWPSEQAAEVKEAIDALFAEPMYENGRKADGVSVRFLMRMTMLKVAAEMLRSDDPMAVEARDALAPPAQGGK